ncbi:hypothetical protein FB45DRAFT_298137 [Roridomyces roridus]|uniref:Uncharacterized protein n=1 Tax=Roridomyces roridus TaxID=1738132 RepID=A0AAD7FV12_9AGAR|nr:hypothetical protein FB45DRAFT_298137 [Roridomyces roridus]
MTSPDLDGEESVSCGHCSPRSAFRQARYRRAHFSQSKNQGCHQIVLLFVRTSHIPRGPRPGRGTGPEAIHIPDALATPTPTSAAQSPRFPASRTSILVITGWAGRASPGQSLRMKTLSPAFQGTEHEELMGPSYSSRRYPHHTSTASVSYLTQTSPRRRLWSIHRLALLPPSHLFVAVADVGLAALSPSRSAPASWSRTIRPGGSASMAREGRASRAGAILSSRCTITKSLGALDTWVLWPRANTPPLSSFYKLMPQADDGPLWSVKTSWAPVYPPTRH